MLRRYALRVIAGDRAGSGILVDAHKRCALTCYHVVADSPDDIEIVYFPNSLGPPYKGRATLDKDHSNAALDIAVLHVRLDVLLGDPETGDFCGEFGADELAMEQAMTARGWPSVNAAEQGTNVGLTTDRDDVYQDMALSLGAGKAPQNHECMVLTCSDPAGVVSEGMSGAPVLLDRTMKVYAMVGAINPSNLKVCHAYPLADLTGVWPEFENYLGHCEDDEEVASWERLPEVAEFMDSVDRPDLASAVREIIDQFKSMRTNEFHKGLQALAGMLGSDFLAPQMLSSPRTSCVQDVPEVARITTLIGASGDVPQESLWADALGNLVERWAEAKGLAET